MPPKRKSAKSSTPSSTKRARPPPKPIDIASYKPVLADGTYTHVQRSSCQNMKGAELAEKCMSCTEKQSICGGCRFVNLRAFRGEQELGEYVFRGNAGDEVVVPKEKAAMKRGRRRQKKQEEPVVNPPPPVVATSRDADYALPIIAPTFAGHLRRELEHEKANEGDAARPLIRIQCTPLTRSLCDFCATSIFMGSYMCGCCGREFCLGCWETWTPSGDLHGGRLMRRDQCTKRRRHAKENMVFATRAKEGEISTLLGKVEARMPTAAGTYEADEQTIADIPTATVPNFLPVPTAPWMDIPLSSFQALLRKGGTPLVLTGLRGCFSLPWDAEYFTAHFGAEECILHSPTSDPIISTVASFFETFTSPPADAHWKLKDWPPTAAFSTTFPSLFADFEAALPFPSYTRRSGPLNLASHFPPAWNAPDLGPKMYNAFPAPNPTTATTNLHLDLTDAVNIMLYSSSPAAAGALWDIFPPTSAASIRAYLAPRNPTIDDPIHRQLYYLADTDIDAIPDARPYRILQRPGDAVFIPAGCPHQVRNLASCVKVAVDFLSPEGVETCRGLVEEARRMAPERNEGGARGLVKEDVLQLWGCLGFAWEGLEKVMGEGGDGEGVVGVVNGDGKLGDGE